jgi:hypothetical protein
VAAGAGTPAHGGFANVFGNCVEDYLEVLRVLNDHEGWRVRTQRVAPTRRTEAFFSSDPALLSEGGMAGRWSRGR